MTKEKLIQQCSEYFKNNPGFSRAFDKIRDKYISLGKIGGTIKINNLTMEEKEALTGFLKKNYYKNSVSISVNKFEEALKGTPFQGLDFPQILETYFEEDIITKKEKIKIYEEDKMKFFHEILNEFTGTKGYQWIKYTINSKKNGYRIISQGYDRDREKFKKDLIITIEAINNLPFLDNKVERLALFSSKISKNPHALDHNTDSGKLLLYGIAYLLGVRYPQNAEEKMEVLYKVGLIKDEISNFTMCSGLLAYKDELLHPGWEGFFNAYEPLQVSLWNLSKVDKIISKRNKVFVFENPTVFSEVLYRSSKEKPSIICTYGQVKLASLILLDNLVENGTHIYYSGDFDPEGLIIADKLKSRYKEYLTLWRYSIKDYHKSISKKKIAYERINKLRKLKDKSLIKTGEEIKECKYAGYQETIIEELIDDILVLMNIG